MFYQIPVCLNTRFKVFLEELTVIPLVKNNSLAFVERGGPLPCSRKPAVGLNLS
jgi:hypothetical protein